MAESTKKNSNDSQSTGGPIIEVGIKISKKDGSDFTKDEASVLMIDLVKAVAGNAHFSKQEYNVAGKNYEKKT